MRRTLLQLLGAGWLGLAPAVSTAGSAIDPWSTSQARGRFEPQAREELLEYLSQDWWVWEGRYVRFYAADRTRTHPAAIRRLEDFVEDTMDRLGMPADRRRDLQRDKMRYFLCGSTEEVQLLGGEATEGITLVDRRAVVTRWLPHEHEIVHLLANLTVGPAPSGAEPLFQEGLACALGGRRGMGRLLVLHQGEEVLAAGRVDIFGLFGHAAFNAIDADASAHYAAAGRFVQFLLETGGMPRFLRLYRLLTGTPEEVSQRPSQVTVMQLEEIYGRSWSELAADFETWRATRPTRLMEVAAVPPRDPDLWASDDGRVVSVWNEQDGSMVVRLEGQRRVPDGLVLWGPELPPAYRSRLLPGPGSGASGGRRFGLKLAQDRVALYDFVMDRLVAHFEPGVLETVDVLSPERRRLSVRILPEALEGVERPAALTLRATPTLEP